MTQEQTIPVVDLRQYTEGGEQKKQAFITKLGDALKALGFVAIEGHGVDRDLIQANYAAFKQFFALDPATKAKYEDTSIGRQRGYTSFGVEHAKNNTKPDLKEFYHVGRQLEPGHPLFGRVVGNIWPDEEMPGLRAKALEFYDAMDHCSQVILEAFSLYLGQPAQFLPKMVEGGSSLLRVIHYPVCDGFDEPGVMRAAQHEDINIMTLLPESTESGLELLTREGEWMPIHAIPGQMIMDTGDMLKRITNDAIPSTTHRVVNPQGEPTPRYSMPFFVHPHPDYLLEVLPEFIPQGEAPKHEPITSEDFLFERLKEIGVKK